MKYTIRLHPEAQRELRFAYQWYRDQNPEVALKFELAVNAVLDEISSAPQRWPGYIFKTKRALLLHFPYAVVFRADSVNIQIIAIAHTSRRPGYWAGRS
jgi:toxin ParE1/3/4